MKVFVFKVGGNIGLYSNEDEDYSNIEFDYDDGVEVDDTELEEVTDLQRQVDVVDGRLIVNPDAPTRDQEVRQRRQEARDVLKDLDEANISAEVKVFLLALRDLVPDTDE